MTQTNPWFQRLIMITAALALIVIMVGAFTRLTDAGLGCPDWPGCYGHLIVPDTASQIRKADALFPGQPVETAKAWTEMGHRYIAGTLGLLIMVIAGMALFAGRKFTTTQLKVVPILLIGLVIFQALLGMWTVTLKLQPVVVMGHLMGGLGLLALLWLLNLQQRQFKLPQGTIPNRRYLPWAILGLLVVIGQIFLGGWTSANYAALACTTFPFCHGHLLPALALHQAFNFVSPINPLAHTGTGINQEIKLTIQVVHRIGAAITLLYLTIFSMIMLVTSRSRPHKLLSILILTLLILQIALGILNVVLLLPLGIAVLHTAMAALLLLTMVTVVYSLCAPAVPKAQGRT